MRRLITSGVASASSATRYAVGATGSSPMLPRRSRAQSASATTLNAHGGYSNRYVASFVGFVPASRPRLVVLVMVDEPKTAIWGGAIAAPAFQRIASFDLQYLEVPPDAPQTTRPAGY